MARSKEFNEEEVLDKAVELFWHKGYNGISAEELVQGLELSRSSLYSTFGDKHTLFKKALQRYRNKITAPVVEMLDTSENIPATIAEIFRQSRQNCLEIRNTKGCFMVNSRVELAPHNPEIAEIVQENWQALEDAYFRALKRGQETKQISMRHDARALARFILNSSWGLSVYGKADAEGQIFDDITKVVLSAICIEE